MNEGKHCLGRQVAALDTVPFQLFADHYGGFDVSILFPVFRVMIEGHCRTAEVTASLFEQEAEVLTDIPIGSFIADAADYQFGYDFDLNSADLFHWLLLCRFQIELQPVMDSANPVQLLSDSLQSTRQMVLELAVILAVVQDILEFIV